MTVATFTARVSKPERWLRHLHRLTAELVPRPVVELRTAVGISGLALRAAMPRSSQLWTLDANGAALDVARAGFDHVAFDGVHTVVGTFRETLPGMLEQAAPVDLMFVDGNHRYQPTLDYLEFADPQLGDAAVVVFDGIRWSAGMRQAWAEIARDPALAWTLDLGPLGIACLPSGSPDHV